MCEGWGGKSESIGIQTKTFVWALFKDFDYYQPCPAAASQLNPSERHDRALFKRKAAAGRAEEAFADKAGTRSLTFICRLLVKTRIKEYAET